MYLDFDEADFSVPDPDAHPDEVVLLESSRPAHHSSGVQNGHASNGVVNVNQIRPSANRQQPTRPPAVVSSGTNNGGLPPQPQTPHSGLMRSTSGAGQMRPPQDAGPPKPVQQGQPADSAQFIVAGKVRYQPSRAGLPSTPASPARLDPTLSDSDNALPPPGAGFFSAKAAARITEGSTGEPLPAQPLNLPAFNPHADSPSFWKTPGVDHNSTKPLTRELKHVPGSTQSTPDTAGPGGMRGNVVNPQLNAARRIGAPGASSPMANRGSYKPPTLKRPVEGAGVNRAPLVDLPANGTIVPGEGGDIKRQRLSS